MVVNTCAFIEEARKESIDAVLSLADAKAPGASLVVTGCLAERYGDELAEALPEADRIAGFGMALIGADPGLAPATRPAGTAMSPAAAPATPAPSHVPASPVPVELRRTRLPAFDLLNLPRPRSPRPWAYVVPRLPRAATEPAGFCAIPSFRGPQRSRSMEQLLHEVDELDAAEIVLVAQDLASYGRDQGRGERRIVPLVEGRVSARGPYSAAVPVSVGPQRRPRRSHLRHRGALLRPVAAARVAAAAAPDAALGAMATSSWLVSGRSAVASPMPPSARTS